MIFSCFARICLIFSFFAIIRRPLNSPLFPYTTLFRSRPAPAPRLGRGVPPETRRPRTPAVSARWPRRRRSEEHTSELQSLTNLVCRLLLEKKKNLTESLVDGKRSQSKNFSRCARIGRI